MNSDRIQIGDRFFLACLMCSRCRQVTKEVDREKGKKLGRGLLRPDALNTRERGEKQGRRSMAFSIGLKMNERIHLKPD